MRGETVPHEPAAPEVVSHHRSRRASEVSSYAQPGADTPPPPLPYLYNAHKWATQHTSFRFTKHLVGSEEQKEQRFPFVVAPVEQGYKKK